MDALILIIGTLFGLGVIAAFFGGIWFDRLEIRSNEAAKNVEKNHLFVQDLAAAIIERDKEGKIIFCSPYVEVLTGYSRQEIYASVEDFFLSICPPDHKERVFRSMKITELSGEPFQFQFPFHHKSGIEMWAESRVVPLFDDEQEIKGTIAVTLDVTAMVLQQKLVELKNAELKEFTSIVSHDLKAPIYTINGLINVIREDFSGEIPHAALEIFSTIEHSGHRLEQLVQAILDYARLGVKEFIIVPVQLTEVFEDVIAEHQHSIDSLKVSLHLGELPEVLGDRSGLTQIFSNLIGNAIKYRKPDQHPEIHISSELMHGTKQIKIKIQDNGIGIPHDRIQDVFKPFVRVQESEVEGSGVGLATVKKLVERFGGTAAAESISTGTIFTVILRTP